MSKLRSSLSRLALIALLAGFLGSASADTLDMRDTSMAGTEGRPTRGMTQASVEAKFGSPQSKRPAVGDPPISRWEYANMVVFFEYDRVIHAVLKR